MAQALRLQKRRSALSVPRVNQLTRRNRRLKRGVASAAKTGVPGGSLSASMPLVVVGGLALWFFTRKGRRK